MQQVKWFERKFDFATQNIFPSIIERLEGTSLRLETKINNYRPELLSLQRDGKWSIKEQIGHLIDLEPLWQGRLNDIINGMEELRPTDLTNSKTTQANHNDTPTELLLAKFGNVRAQTMQLLATVDEEIVFKSALHPRLKTPMRTMDLFLFVAEHDDHHLAEMTDLANYFGRKPA